MAVAENTQVEVEHLILTLLSDPDVGHFLERVGARLDTAEAILEEELRAPREFGVKGASGALGHNVELALELARESGGEAIAVLASLLERSLVAHALRDRAQLSASGLMSRVPEADMGTAGGSPYRRALAVGTHKLWLRVAADAPDESLSLVLAPLGLSPVRGVRARLGARASGGVELGPFTEPDAQRWLASAEESARASSIAIDLEVRPCVPQSGWLARRARVARRRRAARMLWMAAALCAVGALGLVLAGLRPPPPPLTIDQAHAVEQGVHVRVLGQVPDARRYLLSEGPLYVADPREPRELLSAFDDYLYRARDVRVRIRQLPAVTASFVADRGIVTKGGIRTVPADWSIARCPKCQGDVLIVRPRGAPPSAPLEATVRGIDDLGRPAEEVSALHRRHGGKASINYVLDLEPLPEGPAQELSPICAPSNVEDRDCTPLLWAEGSVPGSQSVLEGRIVALEDERLRLRSSEQGELRPEARVLELGGARSRARAPERPLAGAAAGLSALLAACAWWLRRVAR